MASHSLDSYNNGNVFVFPDVDVSEALKGIDWIKLFDLEE